MDLKEMMNGGGWTEERHAAFLTSIEESFINRMFNTDTKTNHMACFSGRRALLPLDRTIPDSGTESTLDSRITIRSKPRQLAEPGKEKLMVVSKNTNRTRKRELLQLDTYQDQVVPQPGSFAENSKKKLRRIKIC